MYIDEWDTAEKTLIFDESLHVQYKHADFVGYKFKHYVYLPCHWNGKLFHHWTQLVPWNFVLFLDTDILHYQNTFYFNNSVTALQKLHFFVCYQA